MGKPAYRPGAARRIAIFSIAVVSLLESGCQSKDRAVAGASMEMGGATRMAAAAAPEAPERAVIRRAWMRVSVEKVPEAVVAVERIAKEAGGYVENKRTEQEISASIEFRVPEKALEGVLDDLAALGDEEERNVNATDVTDQLVDLDAALQNNLGLRDRLRALLARATKVEDLVNIETELARVQTNIDQMEGQLKRIRSQVSLSERDHRTRAPARPGSPGVRRTGHRLAL